MTRAKQKTRDISDRPRRGDHKNRNPEFWSYDLPSATFMFIELEDGGTLWTSTSALRRNGYLPSNIARELTEKQLRGTEACRWLTKLVAPIDAFSINLDGIEGAA